MLEEFGEEQRGERGHFRWFEHNGIASRQRRGNLPRHEQDWVVPGDDGCNDAIRLFEHERELGLFDGWDDASTAADTIQFLRLDSLILWLVLRLYKRKLFSAFWPYSEEELGTSQYKYIK